MQNYNDELQHVGVKGMRWGRRKSSMPTSDLKRRYDAAKEQKKTANKAYSKSWNKTTANPLNSVTKKGDERYNQMFKLAEKAGKADDKFKEVKQERKAAIKQTTKDINRNTKMGEKLLYDDATRKLAAKHVVDHNMTVEEATKKSHKAAMRNTAVFMAVYGGMMV